MPVIPTNYMVRFIINCLRRELDLAYSKIEYPDVHHVLNEVKQAGGIAVIAHPGQLKDISLLEQLADRKEIDGIEVWHPSNEESLIAQLMILAQTHHLLMTGGTDFTECTQKYPEPSALT